MTFNGICSKLTRSTCCGTPLSSTSKSEGPSPRIADPPSLSVTSTSTRTASTFEEKLGCDCDKDTMGTRDKDTKGTKDTEKKAATDTHRHHILCVFCVLCFLRVLVMGRPLAGTAAAVPRGAHRRSGLARRCRSTTDRCARSRRTTARTPAGWRGARRDDRRSAARGG